MSIGSSNGGMNGIFPFVPVIDTHDDAQVKQTHDAYQVYVNGDYVGDKVLLVPSDTPHDVDSFLHSRGFASFESAVTGDHITLSVQGEQAGDIKEHLSAYLQTR